MLFRKSILFNFMLKININIEFIFNLIIFNLNLIRGEIICLFINA